MKSESDKDIFDKIMMLPGLRCFFNIYIKYKAVLLYIFFGGLTTIVSVGSFVLLDSVLKVNILISNLISWVFAVLFAYATNRKWVFRSTAKGLEMLREILSFFGGRLFTLGLEEALLLVFVSLLHMNSTAIKLLAQVVVLITNYIISKIVVFKRRENEC